MEHGNTYPIAECLSIWAVIRRWPKISLYELERLINENDGRPPLLQPYEVEAPVDGNPDAETMYLHPMRRGALRIVHVHEFHDEVRDARNRPVASDCGKETIDENGDPMLDDYLWFLLGDVLRLEKENPDYVRTIQQRGRRAPAETPPRPARAEPARPSGRMLRMKEAIELLGIGKTAFYDWVKQGKLPPGIELSTGAIVWPEDELRAFVDSRRRRRNVQERKSKAILSAKGPKNPDNRPKS
ncbi:MAG: helix-turn-helix domain-containing protein [Desulfovibrio sp.]|nr:helix-turn-helix domain-containing protein [Desulfovibrio sp.]